MYDEVAGVFFRTLLEIYQKAAHAHGLRRQSEEGERLGRMSDERVDRELLFGRGLIEAADAAADGGRRHEFAEREKTSLEGVLKVVGHVLRIAFVEPGERVHRIRLDARRDDRAGRRRRQGIGLRRLGDPEARAILDRPECCGDRRA